MRIEKVHYEELFPTGVYANQRLRVEISLDDTDNVGEAFSLAQKKVRESFHQLQLGTTIEEVPDVIPVSPKTNVERRLDAIAGWITTINSMTTISGLKNLSPLVEKTPELQDAFALKLQSLTK